MDREPDTRQNFKIIWYGVESNFLYCLVIHPSRLMEQKYTNSERVVTRLEK